MNDDFDNNPSHPSAEDRKWAMLAHLGAAVGLILGAGYLGWIAPLIIWIVMKGESNFAAAQAKEALNFQIFLLLLNIAMGVFVLITLGLGMCIVWPIAILLFLAELALSFIAAFRTYEGQHYRFPIPLRVL